MLCMCNPGQYLRLGTLISYDWAQVLEACDFSSFCPFALISLLMPLALSVINLVFWALVSMLCSMCMLRRDAQLNLPVLPFLLSHQCHQQSGDWWLLYLQCWQCLRDFLMCLSCSFPEICWKVWLRVDIPIGLPDVARNQSPMLPLKETALVALS